MSTTDAPKGFDNETGPGGLELRSIPMASAAVRAADSDDGPLIEGYGSVSEQSTTIVGWFSEWDEEVAAGAWAATIKDGDIRSMFNHDVNRLLGRTKPGTLELSEDDEGLFYRVQINPDDPNAMSAHAQVKRGDVDGSSVWFRVIRDEWTYPDDDNDLERPKRRIMEGALYETGPVTFPAFEQTSSTARSLRPLDSAMRAAGMKQARRAELLAELLSDPAAAEDQLRTLFDRSPELRDAACSCDPGRAAASAPDTTRAAAAAPDKAKRLEIARRRLQLARPTPV